MKRPLPVHYLIERAGEYYGTMGFWALNIYCPTYFNSKEEAQKIADKVGGKVVEVQCENW